MRGWWPSAGTSALGSLFVVAIMLAAPLGGLAPNAEAATLPNPGPTTSPSPSPTVPPPTPAPSCLDGYQPTPESEPDEDPWNGISEFSKPTPTDLDDHPNHRARFVLDRNWGLTGSTFYALSTTYPLQKLRCIEWLLDGVRVTPGLSQTGLQVLSVMEVQGVKNSSLSFRLTTPGLHYLTLSARWYDASGAIVDRVTTPIYVEDPANDLISPYATVKEHRPTVELARLSNNGRAIDPLMNIVLPNRPTVMLISDFLDGRRQSILPVALPVANIQQALGVLPPVAGLDVSAGFGQVYYDKTTTGLGSQVRFIGQTMADTLYTSGLANVVFVSAIDPATGGLNRAAIRNGLLWAQNSGQVDAVIWGLPSSSYLPAVLSNALRPQFGFSQTPMLPLEYGAEYLPAATSNWREGSVLPYQPESVLEALWKESFLQTGSFEEPSVQNLGAFLADHSATLDPQLRPIVSAFAKDQEFDSFLQEHVLSLTTSGVPVVAPSEDCAALPDYQYMTILGLNHLPGVTTVSHGTKTEPNKFACKGPDRNAASHGTGVDFFADPRIFAADLNLTNQVTNQGKVPYLDNSLGAAAKLGGHLGRLHYVLRTPAQPWTAGDFEGMLAAKANFIADISPWRQGAGFLDLDNMTLTLPTAFARSGQVVFSPFDLMRGRAVGVVQIVVTGAGNVDSTASAPASSWTFDKGADWRLYTGTDGRQKVNKLTTTSPLLMRPTTRTVSVETLAPNVAVVTLAMDLTPANFPPYVNNGVDPPSKWLLPGLYSGRTWISTPSTGILQLPINVGVGTIVDVYRFLAPNTPVPETAVCLALPLKFIGDLTGLRNTMHELEEENICIYWTNTDRHGVARFYTPLPLVYDLISFFSGPFSERVAPIQLVDGNVTALGSRGSGPPYYPHVMETLFVRAPFNVVGINNWAGNATSMGWFEARTSGPDQGAPAYVDADLPYPLGFFPSNRSIAVAISINWRYRDNIEATHILPVPSILSPEFLGTLAFLPNPVRPLLEQTARQAGAPLVEDGLIANSPEHLTQLLNTSQDVLKSNRPVESTYVDALLGRPVARSLPLNLQADPGSCSWGYGHELAPELVGVVDDIFDPARRSAAELDALFAALSANQGIEEFPDTLVMRMQPTLNYLLGLTTNLPLCTAVYPFNLPQPNYMSTMTAEFDLHLESSILIVCVVVVQVTCYILAPNPTGDGNFIVPLDGSLPDIPASAVFATANRTVEAAKSLANDPSQATNDPVGYVGKTVVDIANVSLPKKVGLTADGHVRLVFPQKTVESDHGYMFTVALPLDLSAAGFLDPIVGVLESAGLAPGDLLNITLPNTPLNMSAVGDIQSLLRDSITELLRTQAYIEIKRPVFTFDTWWWDDSFLDARISPTSLLPRSSVVSQGAPDRGYNLGEDFWWLTFPNINREYFARGLKYWDPFTLQPNHTALKAANYPWNQAEFFEVVMQVWDDDLVDDAQMNQIHTHDASTAHDFVNTAKHCTDDVIRDPGTGAILNDPVTGQYCFNGLLAYEEGDGWFMHDDAFGTGVYDPDLGLVNVMLKDLRELNTVFGAVDSTWQSVWSTQVGQPLFIGGPRTLASVIDEQTGINMAELHWWDRGGSPHANRRVYSDLATNSSFFFATHEKSCEEAHDLPGQVVLFLDQHPRWKVTCPWQDGQVKVIDPTGDPLVGTTRRGWWPAGAPPSGAGVPVLPAGMIWWTHRGVQCDAQAWQTVGTASQREAAIVAYFGALGVPVGAALAREDGYPFESVCGNYDGWTYWVQAAAGFDGPLAAKANAFGRVKHPLYYPGSFEMDFEGWKACKAVAPALRPWPCSADNPMAQMWSDLASHVPSVTHAFTDPKTNHAVTTSYYPLEIAALLFGMNYDQTVSYTLNGVSATYPVFANNRAAGQSFGGDKDEIVVTVPLPAEWPGFYSNPVVRQFDWNASRGLLNPQVTNWTHLVDDVADVAPLLRAWLAGDVATMNAWFAARGLSSPFASRQAGNPFWSDVSGQKVPWQEIARPRNTVDTDAPARLTPAGLPTGKRGCVGAFWWGQCHDQEVTYDAGDLSLFGRGGFWGREANKKITFIPQGSTYARWNAEHLIESDGQWVSTRNHTTGRDEGACWFDPIAKHGLNVHGAHPIIHRPFDVTRSSNPTHAGTYNHEEPGSGGYEEPVPSIKWGYWCADGSKAKSEREYVHMRLPIGMRGSDPSERLNPPVSPFVAEGPFDADVVALRVGTSVLPKLVTAVIQDALGIGQGIQGGQIGSGLGLGVAAVEGITGVNPLAVVRTPEGVPLVGGRDVGDIVGIINENGAPPLVQGSPVLPLLQIDLDPKVQVAELVAVHSFDFPAGTQGVFLSSVDGGATWSLLPSRGAPGFVKSSQSSTGAAGAAHVAFFDVSQYSGSSVLIGARILGAGWNVASWDIMRLTVLPAGTNGMAGPPVAGWDAPTTGFTRLEAPTPAALAALGPGAQVVLAGPLTIAAGESLSLQGVTLVIDRCGQLACAITVEGSLSMTDSLVTPMSSSAPGSTGQGEGAIINVQGHLDAVRTQFRGLLSGLRVIGGEVDLSECWLVDTGQVGVLSILGKVRLSRCVVADQVVGAYALGSQVRLEGNFFYRNVRAAGVFDETWGTVKDNWVYHTKQAGFYQRSPLGASNLLLAGNRLEQTGMGIGSALALEDRVLGLDPRVLSVPVSARTRVQGNWMEWNNLEAIEAGPLSAPVIYGNNITHSNIGVRVGWLDPATVRFNNLYSDVYAFTDPQLRPTPANDGNTWSGAWQLLGPSLPVDARDNYWGPGVPDVGTSWPVDAVFHNPADFNYVPYASSWASAPLSVGLTGPGYGGGLLPVLGALAGNVTREVGADEAVSPLTNAVMEAVGSAVDPELLGFLPLDALKIERFAPRNVSVSWDAAADVEAFRVKGSYYGFAGLPNVNGLNDTSKLVDALSMLPVTDRTRVLTPQVVRTEVREIPVSGGSGSFEFAFAGWNESRVLWTVEAVKPLGKDWIFGDGVSTKDAVVHNSIVWPLLPTLAILVNDLAFDTLEKTAEGAFNVLSSVQAGGVLPTDMTSLASKGWPLSLRPDGALSVDGTPSLLALAYDQDPTFFYEFAVRASASDAWTPLGKGLGASRAFALPTIVEGQGLEIRSRAVDASGLASPWVGTKLLMDSHGPSISLDGGDACVTGVNDGVRYVVDEWVDPAWNATNGGRASGISAVRLEARRADGVTYSYDLPSPSGNHYEGVWFPPAGLQEGAVFVVHGYARDFAGHAAAAKTTSLRVDVAPPLFTQLPSIVTDTVAQALSMVVGARDDGCGLFAIEVMREINGVLNQTVVLLPPTTTSWKDPSSLSLLGKTVRYRLEAVDVTGKRAGPVWSNALKFDLDTPIVNVTFPDMGKTVIDLVEWGAGLAGGTVLSPRPASIPITISTSHPRAGMGVRTEVWVDGVNRTSQLSGGVFVYNTSSAQTDIGHVVLVKGIADNGLVTTVRKAFYFPEESSLPLREDSGQWVPTVASTNTFNHEANLVSGYLHVKSRTADYSRLAWSTDLPASRTVISERFYIAWRNCNGMTEFLRVMDGTDARVSFYLGACNSYLRFSRAGFAGETALSTAVATGRWYDLRVVLGEDSMDVYLDGVFLGHWALRPAVVGQTGLEYRAQYGELYIDQLTWSVLGYGFWSSQATDNILSGLAGWSKVGTGSLVSAVEGPGTVLKAEGADSGFLVKSPVYNTGRYTRAVGYVRLDEASGTPTTVFGLEDASGNRILSLKADAGRLTASDRGQPAKVLDTAWEVGEWHRVDVELIGKAYRVILDGDTANPLILGAEASARAVRVVGGQGTLAFTLDRLRFEVGESHDNTFTRPLSEVRGWQQYTTGTGQVVVEPTTPGLAGLGVMRITGSAGTNEFAVGYVSSTDLGGRYAVDSAFRPDATNVPDHMSVMAGYDAAGNVKWSLRVVPLGNSLLNTGDYVLSYQGADGQPQTVSGTLYRLGEWHTLLVGVDMAAGRLDVWLDETLIKSFTGQAASLTPVAYIGFGDVLPDTVISKGGGQIVYDDVRMYRY